MSKLKNTFGLPDSIIDAVNQVNETSQRMKNESSEGFSKDMAAAAAAEAEKLKKQKKLRDTEKATAPEQPPVVLKMGEETLNEIGDTPEGQNLLIKVIRRRQRRGYIPGKDPTQKKAAERLARSAEVIKLNNSFEQDDDLIEATGTYPFKANEMAPLIGTLRMLLNFLASSPSLKKIMKEETGIDYDNAESLINFFEILGEELELIEYRTKGAVGKKTPAPAEDDEEEDEGPAYAPASGKDQEHIMTQLKGAMDTGGRHIDTASGKKYVSAPTAEKIHSHLMSLKAPERAQSSSDLYNLKATHPMTKLIQDDHRAALEKGIKAPTEKKGRGRPSRAQSAELINNSFELEEIFSFSTKRSRIHKSIDELGLGKHVERRMRGKIGRDEYDNILSGVHEKIAKLHGISPDEAKKHVNDYVEKKENDVMDAAMGGAPGPVPGASL